MAAYKFKREKNKRMMSYVKIKKLKKIVRNLTWERVYGQDFDFLKGLIDKSLMKVCRNQVRIFGYKKKRKGLMLQFVKMMTGRGSHLNLGI